MFNLVFLIAFAQIHNVLSEVGFIMKLDEKGNCYINISSLSHFQPLFLLNGTFDGEVDSYRLVTPVIYPYEAGGERHIQIDKDQGIFLACPVSPDKKALSLEYKFCGKEPELKSDFKCSLEITTDSIVTVFSSDQCGVNGNGKILQAGYNITVSVPVPPTSMIWNTFSQKTEEKFIPVMKVCHVEDFTNLFTSFQIEGSLVLDSDQEHPIEFIKTDMEIFHKVTKALPEDAYRLQKQHSELFSAFLVTDEDLNLRTVQLIWKYRGIQTLQWTSIYYGKWINLKNNIKRLAKTFKVPLIVYTGIKGPMKNLGKETITSKLTIDTKTFEMPLPEYMMILLERPDTKECTAFFFFNYPEPEDPKNPPEAPCSDKCKEINWPSETKPESLSGSLKCCSYNDLMGKMTLLPKLDCNFIFKWPQLGCEI